MESIAKDPYFKKIINIADMSMKKFLFGMHMLLMLFKTLLNLQNIVVDLKTAKFKAQRDPFMSHW